MKSFIIVAVIAISAIPASLFARQVTKTVVYDKVQSLQKSSGYLNNLSMKAARDFAERYPAAENEKWFFVKKGFIVRYKIDSIDSRTAYDVKGRWVYSIKVYDEWKLPQPVRHLVKSSYYDCVITQVEEIDRPSEVKVYLVHMYDSTTWKNVQVRDGEIRLVEEFRRNK